MARRRSFRPPPAGLASAFVGAVLAGLAYLAVARFAGGPLEAFFMARGPFQPVSTFLFFYALAVLVADWRRLGRERTASAPSLPPSPPLTPSGAERLLAEPVATRESLASALWTRLLRSYARSEDPRASADRLLTGADAGVRRGGRALSSIRGVLPLVGLVGTVFGLSRGMLDFAAMSSGSGDLRALLLEFASSMSQAFDTTLLAIVYALLLWPFELLLRGREDAVLAHLESELRRTVDGLEPLNPEAQWRLAVERTLGDFSVALSRTLTGAAGAVLSELRGHVGGELSTFADRLLVAWTAELDRISTGVLEAASTRQAELADRVTDAIEGQGRLVVEKIGAIEDGVRDLRPTQLRIVADYPHARREAGNGAAAR